MVEVGACPLRQLQESRIDASVSTARAACQGFGLGRCDCRHKLLFEYPIIFWTPRGSLNHVERALG
jgi:hypothetical protein